jgi:hypothetical protein
MWYSLSGYVVKTSWQHGDGSFFRKVWLTLACLRRERDRQAVAVFSISKPACACLRQAGRPSA